jgi:hypothetical protein
MIPRRQSLSIAAACAKRNKKK